MELKYTKTEKCPTIIYLGEDTGYVEGDYFYVKCSDLTEIRRKNIDGNGEIEKLDLIKNDGWKPVQ